MNKNNTFERDLKRGEQIELKVLSMIKKKYPQAYKVEGYFKDYDIYIPEIDKRIEVKSDEQSKHTGNILIEVEFNNKPSALSTTKADFWVWWDGSEFAWFTVDKIWKCIDQVSAKKRTFIGKGDTKEKKAYLIKKRILYKYQEHDNNKRTSNKTQEKNTGNTRQISELW